MSQCINHAEAEAVGYCRQCGKPLCAECRKDVRGVIYCEDCLAKTVLAGGAQPEPGAPNPALAGILGIIPAVGALYNGEYVKALIHLIIFGGLISILDSGVAEPFTPLFGLLLAAFIIYMPIEAYHTAKRRAAGQVATPTPWGGWGGAESGETTPIGPVILIVLGVLFLLNTMDILPYGFRIWRFWPLALIALGGWLLWKKAAGANR